MTSRLLRWLLRALGATLVLTGLVPLTPLIWLLVILRVDWPHMPFRLQFWQTQASGAVLALCGAGLIALTLRQRRPGPP